MNRKAFNRTEANDNLTATCCADSNPNIQGSDDEYWVVCENCGEETSSFDSVDGAVERWEMMQGN